MIHPDYREFSRLARQSTLVPVVKSITADLLTPVSAFLAIAAREPNAFLLESIERGEQIGRYTFLGAQPYMRLEAHGSEILLHRGKRKEQCHGSALQTAKELLRQHRPAAVPGLPPFTAGAVGEGGQSRHGCGTVLSKRSEEHTSELQLPDHLV